MSQFLFTREPDHGKLHARSFVSHKPTHYRLQAMTLKHVYLCPYLRALTGHAPYSVQPVGLWDKGPGPHAIQQLGHPRPRSLQGTGRSCTPNPHPQCAAVTAMVSFVRQPGQATAPATRACSGLGVLVKVFSRRS